VSDGLEYGRCRLRNSVAGPGDIPGGTFPGAYNGTPTVIDIYIQNTNDEYQERFHLS